MSNFFNKFRYRLLEKIISLLLAFGLWLYVGEKNKPERYITVPLDIKNLPPKFAVSSEYKSTILIKVKGKESTIRSLSSGDFKAWVDLKNVGIGKNRIKVNIKRAKGRFKIIKVQPAYITIDIDKLFHKEVPLSVTVINSPAEGYKKVSEEIQPNKIVIKGPEKIIEKIDVIRTEPIDIGGVTGSIYKRVNFDIPSKFVTPVDYKSAYVSIKIVKNFITKIFLNKKIIVKDLSSEFYIKNIDELIANAKIYGPLTIVNTLDKSNFLYVEAKDIDSEGEYEIKVSINLPKSCSVLYIKPEKIILKVKEK